MFVLLFLFSITLNKNEWVEMLFEESFPIKVTWYSPGVLKSISPSNVHSGLLS